MLARNPDSDNIKLPGCGDFLCIISRELHNDFTSCPQDCPQGRRRSEFAKACGAKACGPPPRREATLTYVALRSKSQAGNKNEESLDASAATCDSHRSTRSEEHTSELQSLMRISYAVFCLKKKKNNTKKT